MTAGRRFSDYVLSLFNYMFLVLIGCVTLFPMLNLFAKAFSAEAHVLKGDILLWPKGFQTEAVGFVLSQVGFQRAFINTVFVVTVGTLLSILFTVCGAYPLSKRNLPGRKWLMLAIVFTMLFNGGLIPTFILVKKLTLLDKLWALILPNLVSPFYLIIMKNYFEGIPISMEESAKIDGCSNFMILARIILPLSMPVIATLIVFYAVARWNAYFEPLLYVTSKSRYTLQQYLNQLMKTFNGSALVNMSQLKTMSNKAPQIIQGAAVFVSIIPILVVYPFLQKYFVKGVMLGAIKG